MMYKTIVAAILALCFYSCSSPVPVKPTITVVSKDDSLRIVANYKRAKAVEDAYNKLRGDTMRTKLLKNLGFPDIRSIDHEAHLFILGKVVFAQPNIGILVEETENGHYKLTSKIFFYTDDQIGVNSFVWKDKAIKVKDLTVVEKRVQYITEAAWVNFKKLLDGSYYQAIGNVCPEGDGILDGEGFWLQSMAKNCAAYRMSYSNVAIHSPNQGSFRDACEYLMKLSDLKLRQ